MMTLPTIHLNGSSKESLVHDARTAYSALLDAADALSRMSPHRRDYYTAPDTWDAATAEHAARIEAVQGVMDSVSEWALAVQNLNS
jgi:hypothetical protein